MISLSKSFNHRQIFVTSVQQLMFENSLHFEPSVFCLFFFNQEKASAIIHRWRFYVAQLTSAFIVMLNQFSFEFKVVTCIAIWFYTHTWPGTFVCFVQNLVWNISHEHRALNHILPGESGSVNRQVCSATAAADVTAGGLFHSQYAAEAASKQTTTSALSRTLDVNDLLLIWHNDIT